jgi:hypothetical protein
MEPHICCRLGVNCPACPTVGKPGEANYKAAIGHERTCKTDTRQKLHIYAEVELAMTEHAAQTKCCHPGGMVDARYRQFLLNSLKLNYRRDRAGNFMPKTSKLEWNNATRQWRRFVGGDQLDVAAREF